MRPEKKSKQDESGLLNNANVEKTNVKKISESKQIFSNFKAAEFKIRHFETMEVCKNDCIAVEAAGTVSL